MKKNVKTVFSFKIFKTANRMTDFLATKWSVQKDTPCISPLKDHLRGKALMDPFLLLNFLSFRCQAQTFIFIQALNLGFYPSRCFTVSICHEICSLMLFL